MTGVTGKLIKEMENKCFESKASGRQLVDKFLDANNIKRCVYQGSESFEGNQARKILKSVYSLRRSVEKEEENIKEKALPFVECLDVFCKVVKSCFGQTLTPYYALNVNKFTECYLNLDISISLKVLYKVLTKYICSNTQTFVW